MTGPRSWSGTLFVGERWMVYNGPLGPTAPHAHHAVQLVASAGSVAVVDAAGRRVVGQAVLVPANVEHSLEAEGQQAYVAYLDPLRVSLAAEAVQLRNDISLPSRIEDSADARRWADLISRACGGASRSAPSDLLAAVMGEARAQLPGTVRLSDVAASLGFAGSTITHRFTAEIGVPFRRWVLWERLQFAAEAVRRGENLTAAAHSSGFADSAHLNRTFRRMFGITPSDVAGIVRWEVATRPERSSP
jgi:AraC-like DNA-binding protein